MTAEQIRKTECLEPGLSYESGPTFYLREIAAQLADLNETLKPKEILKTIDELDPFHDQGNGTNHRLSQCGPNCL